MHHRVYIIDTDKKHKKTPTANRSSKMEIKINDYYWMKNNSGEMVQVQVCDIRQHGNVEIMDWSGSIGRVLVNHSELRQCNCEFAGKGHNHHKNYSGKAVKQDGMTKIVMRKVNRPNF